MRTVEAAHGSKLVAIYTNGTTEFVHPDHLGSTRLVTGVSQNIIDNMDYYPFGQQSAGASATTHKFTSKERDSESGNDYFGARYYASTMGRFMSPDYDETGDDTEPVPYADFENPQSLNLYGYVLNNPLKKTDPNGHWHQECGQQTTSTDANGETVVNANCHDVPDWWNVWTNLRNWSQQQQAQTNAYIAAHPEVLDPKNLRVGIIPWGMTEGLGAGSILKIIEQDGSALHAVIQTSRGPIEVMANMTKEGDKLVLKGVHVGEGEKLSIGEIKQAARELGRQEGASEVEVQGGVRTGGANPGHTPQPFTVKVN